MIGGWTIGKIRELGLSLMETMSNDAALRMYGLQTNSYEWLRRTGAYLPVRGFADNARAWTIGLAWTVLKDR